MYITIFHTTNVEKLPKTTVQQSCTSSGNATTLISSHIRRIASDHRHSFYSEQIDLNTKMYSLHCSKRFI